MLDFFNRLGFKKSSDFINKLEKACTNGELNTVKKLLPLSNANLPVQIEKTHLALKLAAQENQSAVLSYLLDFYELHDQKLLALNLALEATFDTPNETKKVQQILIYSHQPKELDDKFKTRWHRIFLKMVMEKKTDEQKAGLIEAFCFSIGYIDYFNLSGEAIKNALDMHMDAQFKNSGNAIRNHFNKLLSSRDIIERIKKHYLVMPAHTLLLIVLFFNDYLTIRSKSANTNNDVIVRFFKIATQIPMELQMSLANKVFNCSALFVSPEHYKEAFSESLSEKYHFTR